MYSDEVNAKIQAQNACTPASNLGGCGAATTSRKPLSLRQEAEKNVGYHREQADKHDRAAAFFRENPAFDQFIQLLRSGAIQI